MRPLTEGREVQVLLAEGLPFVFMDPELMQLAFRQLVDNALKYSSPRSPIKIGARAERDHVIISVTDQGPGIAEDEQVRIFGKFYRANRDRHLITGTGMGLTIAREIARAHGGEVGVRSSPGYGSEFSISVPVASGEESD